MKNKLLLLVLPALLVLSSCTDQDNRLHAFTKTGFFQEDTLAHEELFGEENVSFELGQKVPLRSVEGDMAEPIIGVQWRSKYEKVEDSGEWFTAVRFVAAVKTLDVNVTWTRNIYKDDSTKLHDEASFPTTKAYTELNSNSTPITPSSFGAGYNYFVVYSLYDIPFESVDDYCVVAYATLSDTTEPAALSPVSSKMMAARIGGGAAKFESGQTGYFLAGTFNETPNSIIVKDAVTSEGDKARFTVPLTTTDSFVIVNNDTANSKFHLYDYSKIQSGGSSDSFESDDSNIKPLLDRVFILYVNGSDRIWTDTAAELYVNGVNTAYSNIRTNGSDKVKCTLTGLHEDDTIQFKKGNDYLHFYYTFGTDKDAGTSYTILEDGDYTFFVTSSDTVFYSPAYNCKVELTFDLTSVSWANQDSFRIHAWNDHESNGTWNSAEELLTLYSGYTFKYTLLSKEECTHFQLYFYQGSTEKRSSEISYTFTNGHSYSITVSPGDWGGDGNNTFYSGIAGNIVDTTA